MNIDYNWVVEKLPKRRKDSHKGDFGKVFVIAGSNDMTGCVYFNAMGALRSGAGLVCACVPEKIKNVVMCKMNEPTFMSFETSEGGNISAEDMERIVMRAKNSDAVCIGSGMGNEKWVGTILENIIREVSVPIIIDADGINYLAQNIDILRSKKGSIIITPHEGEMSRLTSISVPFKESQRVDICRNFAQKHNIICLLKGKNTVISDGNVTYINTSGNDGMATGGSGDILTGIIATFSAQGVPPLHAAAMSAYIHGCSGDMAASDLGRCGMIAGDILERLPIVIKEMEVSKII